jgi:hypothetical protein
MIILPINDPELYEYNKKMADKITAQGRKVMFVKMKRPEISIPELELISASPH